MSPEDIKMIATKPVHARKLTDLVSSCNSSASRSRAESNARDASEANGTASRGASSAKSRSSEGKAEPDARSASGSAASTPKKARGVHRPPTRTRAVARNKPATSNNQAPPQNHQEVVIDAHVQANSATRSEPEAVDIAQAAINSQISEAPQQSTEESRLESASSAPTNDDFISHVTNAEVIAEGRLSAEATPETTEIIAVEDVKSSRGASPEAASSRAHLDAKDDENAETNNLRRSPSTEAAASGSAATSKEATTPEERSEEGASLPIRVLDDSNEGGEELTSASAVPTSSDAIPPPPPPQPYLLPPKSEWPDFPVRAVGFFNFRMHVQSTQTCTHFVFASRPFICNGMYTSTLRPARLNALDCLLPMCVRTGPTAHVSRCESECLGERCESPVASCFAHQRPDSDH